MLFRARLDLINEFSLLCPPYVGEQCFVLLALKTLVTLR
jgi:hypothetical protein